MWYQKCSVFLVTVGFTEDIYSMDTETSSDICLTVFGLNSTDIHSFQSIHLTLNLCEHKLQLQYATKSVINNYSFSGSRYYFEFR